MQSEMRSEFLIKKYEISFCVNFHSRLDFLEENEIEIGQKYSNTKQTYNSLNCFYRMLIDCSSKFENIFEERSIKIIPDIPSKHPLR